MRVSATMLGQLALSFLLACLIPSVLCPPPAYQHALPDSTDHAVQPEVRLDVIEPEKFSSPYTSKASPRQPPPSPAKPTINITAIFEEEDMDDFVPEFERALRDIVGHNNSLFSWSGKALVAYRDVKKMVSMLCAHFQGDRSHVRLIIVFGRNATIQTINIVSEALGIPVLGYVIQRGDGYMQFHNPLFLSLQPSKRILARGLVNLLSVNFWFRLTMITQEELRHDGFHGTFRDLTQDGKWTIEDEVYIHEGITDSELNSSISSLSGNTSRIFVLHATAALTHRIFLTAKRVLPRHNRFAWIITENAYTRDEDMLLDFPLGTKAFLVNPDVHLKELLADIMEFVMESSVALYVATPFIARSKGRSCWSAKSETIYPSQDPVYSALVRTNMYGLTGQVAFDDDGFLNISKFHVRNLVYDGRQSVWQDIGCVQGKEVRPFGIIWPGDAKSLKAETEGKKRYKVVTNPVQPFVMTEAPHADYGTCLSDTPCLNLTNKVKSQEVVWQAIEAYENGSTAESGLFVIQCCRGLTIDLLNKLASDLDFEFTLYIVQDETYGQRSSNGTWSGIMRDLTDNTAHFAVAAFSITNQREVAIDFTDPYFFSGFSIIYSDRTRETSMLAFLEPFSTKVWFAILVSAHITAVCMALFEWNSPFGLNPWGRKRNKNYSLASGLTMVFSVLFGHTVKTKSPKAWPSKVMQNFWAFAAIFIIASYTANLAAFIAGKHAGINYYDIQDPRLQDIRIGLLPGSAVHDSLKNGGSKLVSVADRYPVPKTDEGIDWVIKGKLDALLGDYPILDYARAHLAPSCELKLISKIFGDDKYGLGLPRESPLKAALSKKISEYHRTGFIDDLTDVHFADAHCFKRKISQEDSQLEVTHHAGLFVMLCVGFGVGALVLVLEHIVYKFLVPYIRQCPEESTWRSVHLMFFSQRLQRTIASAELVSINQSAKEMMGIFKSRDFARLFQKSTIRRNRLADIAKTKRLNRNFCDIVEKAKWLKEMKDSGLTDDDTLSTPTIIEIPLKQLTVNVELGNSCLKLDHIDSPPSFRKVSAPKDSSGESSSAESDDSLLGASRGVSDRSLPNATLSGMASPPEAHRTSSRRSQKAREAYRRQRYRKYSKAATASSPDLDLSPSFGVEGAVSTETDSGRHRSLSVDCTCPPMLGLDSPPNNKRHRRSPGSALPSASFVNELSPPCKSKHQKESWDSDRSRFTSSKSNRNEKESGDPSVFAESCDLRLTDDDDGDSPHDSSISPVLDVCSNLLKQKTGDQHNLVDHTECRCDQKALLPKTSNISVSLLHKTRSYQDHLCSLAEASRAEDSPYHFSLDNVTKEELLVLWKSSEIELSRRLEIALKEKAKLERRLAMLQKHSPV